MLQYISNYMQEQMEAQHYLQNIYQLLSKQQNNIHIQKKLSAVLQQPVMQKSHNLHSFLNKFKFLSILSKFWRKFYVPLSIVRLV